MAFFIFAIFDDIQITGNIFLRNIYFRKYKKVHLQQPSQLFNTFKYNKCSQGGPLRSLGGCKQEEQAFHKSYHLISSQL